MPGEALTLTSVSSTNIPNDAPCNHENLLRALKSDNVEEFQEALEYTSLNPIIIIDQNASSTVPWMVVNNNLPLVCLCAFLAAEKCFNYLLVLGVDLSARDSEDRSLGHFAVAGGSMEILRLLDIHAAEDHNRLFNSVDSSGNSSAHFAAKFGRMEALQWLCAKGIELNTRNSNGTTPFMWSCSSGQLPMAKFLLDHGRANINDTTRGGWSALHHAVAQNKLETTKFLLEQRDITVDLMNDEKLTPLMIAIANGALDCVKLLVEHGCLFSGGIYKNRFRSLDIHPIIYAVQHEELDIAEYLVGIGNAWRTLDSVHIYKIVKNSIGNEIAFRSICNKLSEDPRKTEFGKGAVFAALNGDCSARELATLMEITKVDINHVLQSGERFLHVAVRRNNADAVRYLVENGADINAVSLDGNTALSLAISKRHGRIAEYLAEQESLDVTKTFNGKTYSELCASVTDRQWKHPSLIYSVFSVNSATDP